MLLSTPLHPAKIVGGKLFSALSYVFLLIFAAIPVASLIYVFGGVSLRDMLKALIILIVVAITLGVLGIFMSTLAKRSLRATVISYILIFVLLFGSAVIYAIVGIIQNNVPPRWILVLNPVSALASALSNVTNTYNSIMGFIPILGADLSLLRGETFGFDQIPRPLYHYSIPLYGFLSIFLYFLSTRLIMPAKKWKLSRKEILVFMSILFLLVAGTAGAYILTTDRYENAPITQNVDIPFSSAIREPAVPQVVVAEMEPAPDLKVDEGNSSGILLDDQPMIYSMGINSAVEEFSKDRGKEPGTLYLVSTIMDNAEDKSYTFNLPEPVQLNITDQLSADGFNVIWVETTAQAIDNPEFDLDEYDYVINLGDTQIQSENSVTLYVNIRINEESKYQIDFTFSQSEHESWEIISQEIVIDAQ
jgi:hypothetical protein